MRSRSQNSFASVQSEGAILPADLLRRIAEGDSSLGGLEPAAYHLPGREKLSEAVSRSWSRLLGAWAAFKGARDLLPGSDPGTTLTRERWLLPLFQELGYGRLLTAKAIVVGEKSYPVSHAWQNTPIHLVSFRVDLDRRQPGVTGASRSSPQSLVQEVLNRSPGHLWGFVSNGLRLRVLRDNASLNRQAFVEFDLEAMFDGELYADFAVLWLLGHQSRVEAEQAEDCWLERWSKAAKAQGTRALDRLRDSVQAAISALGAGFLTHPANAHLRDRLRSGAVSPDAYYRELLRHVYRLLFLFVAEDRDLLHPPGTDPVARDRYARFFSTQRLRQFAARSRGSRHADIFVTLRLVVSHLASAEGCPVLGLPALGSFLFSEAAVPVTGGAALGNRDILEAIRALAYTEDAGIRRTTDYRNLGAEELGSVYESLLDLSPDINVPAGQFQLQHGGKERRATGSHYTPTSILKTVLDFALEPAIRACLKQPNVEEALLSLKILDPACGSGHFLIAAAQRVARRVAAIRTGDEEPAPEAIRHAVRDVVARCVYGIDVNPMAVELCKVALWMETLEPGKPLGFLDYRIRCGDSLLGVPLNVTVIRMKRDIEEQKATLDLEVAALAEELKTLPFGSDGAERVAKKRRAAERKREKLRYDLWPEHVPDEAFKATAEDDKALVKGTVAENRKERLAGHTSLFKRQLLEAAHVPQALHTLNRDAEDSVIAVEAKARALAVVEESPDFRGAKLAADTWCATFFWPISSGSLPAPTDDVFQLAKGAPDRIDTETREGIDSIARGGRFLHLDIAFPEVFTGDEPGFDVVIGNPPYLGGLKISSNLGDRYLNFLKVVSPEASGTTDLSAYFFRRGFDLLKDGGDLGFLATNTIAQGDTRAAALAPITTRWGGQIANAIRSMPWEGVANLEVAVVHVHRGVWLDQERSLDGRVVSIITPMLDDGGGGIGEPVRVRANAGLAFIGAYVLGMGFVLEPEEAQELIERNPRNKDVLFPYLNGEDLNSRPDQSASRWVINFFDWPLDQESAPEDYEGPVAADYPDCLEIVRTRVKPERDIIKDRFGRDYWWRFMRLRGEMLQAISRLPRAFCRSRVADTHFVVPVDSRVVLNERLAVFASASWAVSVMLGSSIHETWARRFGSTLRTDMLYNPSDCFETFPFPIPNDVQLVQQLDSLGTRYDAHRRSICLARQLGLTKVYNLFHDPATESDDAPCQKASPPFDDIRHLRSLHVETDRAVLAAYGWTNLDPRHAFYHGRDAGDGVADDDFRFTVHPEARTEILRHFLALNYERAAEEKAILERGEKVTSAFDAFRTPGKPAELGAPSVAALGPRVEAAGVGDPSDVEEPFRRVRPVYADRYKTCVPLLSLKAAAGAFGEGQLPEFQDWVEPSTSIPLVKGMFVAQVVGRSMQPLIPDGAYCLFRYPVLKPKNEMTVLAQHHGVNDTETGGSYTVKRLRRTGHETDEGWRWDEIRLEPTNSEFRPIVLSNLEEGELRVLAEFIEVLKASP